MWKSQKKTRRRNNKRKHQQRRNLRVESLERRDLMAIDVFLDFDGMESQLNEMLVGENLPQLTSAESTAIEAGIEEQVGAFYDGFDLAFHTQTPNSGRFETIDFGEDGPTGTAVERIALGQATDGFPDHRNRLDGRVEVYPDRVGIVLDAFSESDSRAHTIAAITNIISGVAAHELAHNLGLTHADHLGNQRLGIHNPTNQSNMAIKEQMPFLMYSGNHPERARFAPFSQAKLEYAEGALGSDPNGAVQLVSEAATNNGTVATAQPIGLRTGGRGPISNLHSINVSGALSSVLDRDYYEFRALSDDVVSVKAISTGLAPRGVENVFDSIIEIRDATGALVASNDTIRFGDTGIGSTQPRGDGADAMLLNVALPSDGDYYFVVRGHNAGNYELFATLNPAAHQNLSHSLDVNDDGLISPNDALIIINALNSDGIRQLPVNSSTNITNFVDTTGDGLLSPQDALRVINHLNAHGIGPASGEADYDAHWNDVRILDVDNFAVSHSQIKVTPSQDGILTVIADLDPNAGDVGLSLRDADGNLLAMAPAAGGQVRIDAYVSDDEDYTLYAEGSNDSVDFTLVNRVNQTGATVTVNGTPNEDAFGFFAGSSEHVVQIADVSYAFDADTSDKFLFGGGQGEDTATIEGSSGTETAYIRPTISTMYGPGYVFQISAVEELDFHGGGGTDRANMYDTAGNERLTAYPDHVELKGASFTNTASNFRRVYTYASGGNDLAYLYDSAGDDRFIHRSNYSYLSGAGYMNLAKGFDEVHAIANRGGNDRAWFYDSDGDDEMHLWSTYAIMLSENMMASANGFAEVSADSSNGGVDRIYLDDTDFIFSQSGDWL